ncbi:MAG: hypothetical protein NZ520_00405, partial [bacterium]|nr:hypothetical protein [bacterium]
MYNALCRALSALRATAALLVLLTSAHAQWNVALVGWVGGSTNDVHVQGNYAYCTVPSGLIIMDVSDPAAPREVARISLPGGYAWKLDVSGGFAYVANELRGLRVIDVSDPLNPREVGADESTLVNDVALSGGYAFVATGPGGLRVIDVSDPQNPQPVSSVDTPGSAARVFVSGQHAYVADERGGLRVIDVSDPQNPREVASVA